MTILQSRQLKVIGRCGLVLLAAFVASLAVINALDFARYRNARNRGRTLSKGELEYLGQLCTTAEREGVHRAEGEEISSDFRMLKPVRVSTYPGTTDVTLYEHSCRYVLLRVSTSENNQEIGFVSHAGGPQASQTLWDRNPAWAKARNPVQRLVTVSQNFGRGSRDWIVLPEELLVVDRPWTSGGHDTIVGRVRMSDTTREKIQAGIVSIPSQMRGNAYYADGVCDGVTLSIGFSPDGSRANEIELSNTWRSEVGPLLDAISALLPDEQKIPFERQLRQQPQLLLHPQVVYSSADRDRMSTPPREWWCYWPIFVYR